MPRRVPTPEDIAKKAEYTREWRKRNPEKLAAQIKRAAPKNYARIIGDPERAERQRTWCRDGNKKPRLRLIALLGGKCVECGHSDVRSLHVDHVRGTGAEERRMRGRNYYLHMIDNVASGDYQLLCACHNEIKRISEHEQVTSTAPRPRVLAPLADPKKIAQRALNRAAKARVYADPSLLAKKRERDRRDHARLRQRVIDALGGVCAVCGWSDPRALHVDHVNGGGGKHRKAARSSNALYNQFIAEAHTGAFQLLCACCNQQKKIDLAETSLGREGKRKHVHATESPPPKEKTKATSWTPERRAREAAARAARDATDAALALVLAAKREAVKNPPVEPDRPLASLPP